MNMTSRSVLDFADQSPRRTIFYNGSAHTAKSRFDMLNIHRDATVLPPEDHVEEETFNEITKLEKVASTWLNKRSGSVLVRQIDQLAAPKGSIRSPKSPSFRESKVTLN